MHLSVAVHLLLILNDGKIRNPLFVVQRMLGKSRSNGERFVQYKGKVFFYRSLI